MFTSTNKLKQIIETRQIINDLVTEAKTIAKVTSIADNGLPIKSTMFPITLPINIDDEECEKACWITCMDISPGAKNSTKGKPKTSPLSSPHAIEITIKNRIPVKTGPTIVCPNTIKNRKVSFLYKE